METPTVGIPVKISQFLNVQLSDGGIPLHPGQYIQVHSHNPFDQERPVKTVELRTLPNGTLEIFCDHPDVEIKPFEDHWYYVPTEKKE
jgi:hypothetical protein